MAMLGNNPGNIEDGRFAADQPGYAGARNGGRFAAFDTMEQGLAAMAALAGRYADRGINTIAEIVGRWAPDFENPTRNYVDFVSRATGIPANQPIDVRANPEALASIIGAMTQFETGRQVATPDQLNMAAMLGTGFLGNQIANTLDTISFADLANTLNMDVSALSFAGLADQLNPNGIPAGAISPVEFGGVLGPIGTTPDSRVANAWGQFSTPDDRIAAAFGNLAPDYGMSAWGVEPTGDYASRIDQAFSAFDTAPQMDVASMTPDARVANAFDTLGSYGTGFSPVAGYSPVDESQFGALSSLNYDTESGLGRTFDPSRAGNVASVNTAWGPSLQGIDGLGSYSWGNALAATNLAPDQYSLAEALGVGLSATPVGNMPSFGTPAPTDFGSVAAPRGSSQPMSVTVEQPSSFYGFPDMATFGTALSQANQNMMAMGLDANTIGALAPSGISLGAIMAGLADALGGAVGGLGGLGGSYGGGMSDGVASGSYGSNADQGHGYSDGFGSGWGKGD